MDAVRRDGESTLGADGPAPDVGKPDGQSGTSGRAGQNGGVEKPVSPAPGLVDTAGLREKLSGGSTEGTEGKRGRGRPKGSGGRKRSKKPPKEITALAASAWASGFRIIAGRRGRQWELENEEAQQLGYDSAGILDKYLRDVLDRFEHEVALAVVLTGVVLSRVGKEETPVEAVEVEGKGADAT